jgi:signal peptidase I
LNARAAFFALALVALGSAISRSTAMVLPKRDPTAAIPALAKSEMMAEVLADAMHGNWSGVKNTGSMLPTLSARDLIVTRSVDIRDLRVGDIIVFDRPARALPNGKQIRSRRLVHRVVQRLNCRKQQQGPKAASGCLRVRTQGDNLRAPDGTIITRANLVARVVFAIDGHSGAIRDMRGTRRGRPISGEDAVRRAGASDFSTAHLLAFAMTAIAGS